VIIGITRIEIEKLKAATAIKGKILEFFLISDKLPKFKIDNRTWKIKYIDNYLLSPFSVKICLEMKYQLMASS
jgi:hypothetical protein